MDIEEQLAGLTPEQFDEWCAFRQVVPDPMARLARILVSGFCVLAAAQGTKIEPADLDTLAPEGEYDRWVTPREAARMRPGA